MLLAIAVILVLYVVIALWSSKWIDPTNYPPEHKQQWIKDKNSRPWYIKALWWFCMPALMGWFLSWILIVELVNKVAGKQVLNWK